MADVQSKLQSTLSFHTKYCLSARIVANISYQDSLISLLEKDISSGQKPHLSIDNEETMIAVCNISDSFVQEDVDPEITMDGNKHNDPFISITLLCR